MRREGSRPERAVAVAVLVTLGLMVLAACAPRPASLEQIRTRKELRLGTLNLPTTYYLGAHGPEGFEYALAQRFANTLGVALVVRTYAHESALRAALDSSEIDIAAAQLTFQGEWTKVGVPSVAYDHPVQVVLVRQGVARPANIKDLSGRSIAVTQGGAPASALRSIAAAEGLVLDLRELAEDAAASPLDELAASRADVTVADARLFAYVRDAYPEISRAFDFPQLRSVQWILNRRSESLRTQVDAFLAAQTDAGTLTSLIEAATPARRRLQFERARVFRDHIEARLPDLQSYFEAAAAETGLDWRLLAALGYQESRWNPRAISPQGAQGVMMLVSATAATVGVADVWDPSENIHGGARYLLEVLGKIPSRIPDPERTWFALAAYNVGYGHLEDARVLTQRRGGDPDRWLDVRRNLPLLEQEIWYLQAKHGYARGSETVQLVDRVQRFLNVLEWRTLPPVESVFQPESEDVLVGTVAARVQAPRRLAKNSASTAPHSAASTPPKTSTR